MDDIYNMDGYITNNKVKVLIIFDDMIAVCLLIKKT